ncbi:MAG: LCP family protein, partial [Clostridiaceae bacterium]|nr:LCP family protein [Clostridiaceae bacterium]
VYFDIPRNMNYEDPTQDLYIHLKKGYQHLDGEQAVNLARFRNYPEGDIDRIAIQQKLLKELAKQTLKADNILKIPDLVEIISENVKTDIDINEMLWLANEAKNIPLSGIETDMVPGVASTVNSLSYWLPYENALLDLINNRYNPLDSPITINDISIVEFKANHEG